MPTGHTMSQSGTVNRIQIFSDLADHEAQAVTQRLIRQDFKRGEELVHHGDVSDSVFVVLSGRFLVYLRSGSKPVAEIAVGELIGEIGFFSGQPRNATVVAA